MKQSGELPLCFGFRSQGCWIEEALHRMRIPVAWVCVRRDKDVMR